MAEGATEPAGASDAGECESLEEALAKADAASSKAVRRQLLGLLLYAVSTIFGTGMSLSAKLAGVANGWVDLFAVMGGYGGRLGVREKAGVVLC